MGQALALEPAATPSKPPDRAGLGDYVELTKPRITALVLMTAAAGFYVAAPGLDGGLLLHTLIGIALVAGGTSAMNQVLERDVDALMVRTRTRPVAAGRIGPTRAAIFAGLLGGLGVAYLALWVNLLTAGLAAATFVTYDFVYTPLKRVHSFSTVIGAVPDALPILGGWAAASGAVSEGGWVLFGILFLWQLPHFLALAWLLREDYAAAGLRMLSVGDPDGIRTRQHSLLYAAALVPASLLPTTLGLAGPFYFVAALILGIAFAWTAGLFWREVSASRAGRLFRASIFYLPLLLLALVLDKV